MSVLDMINLAIDNYNASLDDYEDNGLNMPTSFNVKSNFFKGSYRGIGNIGGQEYTELPEMIVRGQIGGRWSANLTGWYAEVKAQLGYNPFDYANEGNYVERLNDILSPGGVPLWGAEYALGKALANSNANDYIKPFNEKRMLDAYPHLKTRPVPVHIPGTGIRLDIPRNYVKGAGRVLQGVGIVSSVTSAISDINSFNRGEISGVHLTVNLIMNGIGFLGPWGAGISIVYGLVEDHIW